MNMKAAVNKKNDQQTNRWSGGTTTQLAIFPPDADYGLRNFEWRLSTAHVENEESCFTSLPGVHRHLMILEGHIQLIHEGHREVALNPFEVDEFEGSWNTKSIGQCVDFNLMTRNAAGRLGVLTFPLQCNPLPLYSEALTHSATQAWENFYCLIPSLNVRIYKGSNNLLISLNRGDLLTLHASDLKGADAARLHIESHNYPEVVAVRAEIWCSV